MSVAARGVHARYGRTAALHGIDLDVAPGEIVGVLGPNGAGKTTLIRLIATSLAISEGSLTLLGHDARRPSRELRRRIGYARDEPVHVDALTGRENAELFGRAAGLSPLESARRTAALLPRVQLLPHADRAVSEYSFGMRRKLLLIEGLLHEPALIVLDEPSTGLDPEGREAVRDLLRERVAAGAAVVIATNDLAEAERVCGRVVVLNEGRVVLDGAPADLISRLGATTRFEFALRAARAPKIEVPGAEVATSSAERLVAHGSNGSSPLPALCAAILADGATIVSVEVRRPDLGDVFLKATGREPQAA